MALRIDHRARLPKSQPNQERRTCLSGQVGARFSADDHHGFEFIGDQMRISEDWIPNKDAALQAIHRLPDDMDYRAIAEEIAFLAALEKGEQDIAAEEVVSNEEVRERLESWTSS